MTAVSWSLAELCSAVANSSGGVLSAAMVGATDVRLTKVAALSSATSSDLAFLANPAYRSEAAASRAGAIVLSEADHQQLQFSAQPAPCAVVCDQPLAWFATAAQLLNPVPALHPGVHPGAHLGRNTQVDSSAQIDFGTSIGDGATIGERVWIGAGATIGERAVIGNDTRIFPRAVVLDDCKIGQRCVVHSGAVIGSDGFGFAPLAGRWTKIPQLGAVTVGDDVEIGANTTIDRGAIGDTILEEGVKLDNQIQIAHNVVVGAHTVIAACVGIAGSARIGRRCRIGGAAMIAGHLSIPDGTSIGPATAVHASVKEAGHYTAFVPLMEHRDWQRAAAVMKELPELRSRVRQLESNSESKAAKSKLRDVK